jgi:hypothetical protein
MIAVLVAVTLQMTLALVDSLRHPNGWWAPVSAALAAATCIGVGVLRAHPSADRPAPSTLIYAYEHGSPTAAWATDPSADPVLDAEARAWAVQHAGGEFTGRIDLATFGHPLGEAPAAPARVTAAPPPEVVVLTDTIEADRRHVLLGIRSRIGAERLLFQRDSVGRTRFLSVNGTAVERPGAVGWIDTWGVPDTLVVLEVDMPPEEPIGVTVVEQLLRPSEVLGPDAFARPPELAPDVVAGSDRALFRFSIASFADPRHPSAPAPFAGAF